MKQLTPQEIKQAYMQMFNSDTGRIVYNDLAYRCFKFTTTADQTTEQTLLNEGRRQVMLHLDSMLEKTAVQLKEE